jgi:hypothetical protein
VGGTGLMVVDRRAGTSVFVPDGHGVRSGLQVGKEGVRLEVGSVEAVGNSGTGRRGNLDRPGCNGTGGMNRIQGRRCRWIRYRLNFRGGRADTVVGIFYCNGIVTRLQAWESSFRGEGNPVDAVGQSGAQRRDNLDRAGGHIAGRLGEPELRNFRCIRYLIDGGGIGIFAAVSCS